MQRKLISVARSRCVRKIFQGPDLSAINKTRVILSGRECTARALHRSRYSGRPRRS